jgi:hypothetical protein
MNLQKRYCYLVTLTIVIVMATGCTVKLVAPYDPDLLQKATSMQSEVQAWDLKMRNNAGTISDDPRHPDVVSTISKWHDEAGAMLTLAASKDPDMATCGAAEKDVYGVIEKSIPANLRAAAQSVKINSTAGCEVGLVAMLDNGISDIENQLMAGNVCQASWIPDEYFIGLSQNRAITPAPPEPTGNAEQQKQKLYKSCFTLFKVTPGLPAGSAGANHGRAVSALLTTLQSIAYVENRKKAAETSK